MFSLLSRWLPALALVGVVVEGSAAPGSLQMKDGYFWDPATQDYFLARGVAYQAWNPPVGANQSFDQIDYDLREFKKLHANSVRCEFVWGEIQKSEAEYDWSKPDYLVRKAEELGLRLFVLIGYQYPPKWLPPAYRGVNDRYTTSNDPALVGANVLSDVINYEHPEARRIYVNHIAAVTARYRNSPAIGAWILGNETAYYDLWEDPELYKIHRFIGYDPISVDHFRKYLDSFYNHDIAELNRNWQTNYADFAQIEMPRPYPSDRRYPAYHDLIQWRKQSVGDHIAAGSLAAAKADPNHLRTYSMVGAVFSNLDANHTCEDAKVIVERCAAFGAPLHFWSVNNYAWPRLGKELRSTDFGIAKYHSEVKLPVMVSETGFTSTESIWEGIENSGARQPDALPSVFWEQLMAGVVGIHFFHWSDRNQYTREFFPREQGFGIVTEKRVSKGRVYENMLRTFRQMENVRLDRLLGGSHNPPADVQFLWSANSDMVWPRANQEGCMTWTVLKRLGFQPAIIYDEEFARGDYTNAPALLLSRAYQLAPDQLDRLTREVVPSGVNIHAATDLPGQFDAYHHDNPNWAKTIDEVFGINVTGARPAVDSGVTNYNDVIIRLQGAAKLGTITTNYSATFSTWKYWEKLKPTSAKVILNLTDPAGVKSPALFVKESGPGKGRTALHAYAACDIGSANDSDDPLELYRIRFDTLESVYRDHFRMQPKITLRGVAGKYGEKYVVPDYRLCRDGGILLSVMNLQTNAITVTVEAPTLLTGRRVENLLEGGIVADNSNGTIPDVTVPGDSVVLFYAYASDGSTDASLANPRPDKLWFDTAPLSLSPRLGAYLLQVGHDLRGGGVTLQVALEQIAPHRRTFARSTREPVSGRGTATVNLAMPEPDANDPATLSSREGAEYVLHARLEREGQILSECSNPVQVAWGLRPTGPFPTSVVPGQLQTVTLQWEDLPSCAPDDPMPLDRAALWDSAEALAQRYRVVLQLLSNGQPVATADHITRSGTGSHTFTLLVPASARAPFTWTTSLETAPNVASHDVEESWEGRPRGAMWPNHMSDWFPNPWTGYQYPSEMANRLWLNEGVQLEGSHGSQSVFMVVTNLANLPYAGFGLIRAYPQAWALPASYADWASYSFAFDFWEASGLPCILDLQLKSDNGRWIQFSQPYNPATNRWNTISATLAQFALGAEPGFDYLRIKELVVNVQMQVPGATYMGSFDNIRFLGPESNLGGGTTVSATTTANDTPGALSITPDDSGVSISWTGNGVLQTADELTGEWKDDLSARSPLRLETGPAQRYYRLRQR